MFRKAIINKEKTLQTILEYLENNPIIEYLNVKKLKEEAKKNLIC